MGRILGRGFPVQPRIRGKAPGPRVVVHQIAASGGDYTSLAAWEAAQQRDLPALNEIAVAECQAFVDSFVTLNGWTSGPAHYIEIRAAAGAEAKMPYSAAAYRLEQTGTYSTLMSIQEQYVRVRKLQFVQAGTATDGRTGVTYTVGGASDVRFEQCYFARIGSSGGVANGTAVNIGTATDANTLITFANCYFIGWNLAVNGEYRPINEFRAYNNTIVYPGNAIGGFGMDTSTGISRLYNNIVQGGTAGFGSQYYLGSSTLITAGNVSEDGSAAQINNRYRKVKFVNPAGGDYRLSVEDNSAQNVGSNLTADPYYPLTIDFNGFARTGTWDAGASAAPLAVVHTVAASGGDYTSLSAWETAQQRNLTTLNEVAIADCQAFADTAQVTFDGWTTGIGHYIQVRATGNAKAQVPWSNSAYRISYYDGPFRSAESYVRITGIQAETTADDLNLNVFATVGTGHGGFHITDCYFRHGRRTYSSFGGNSALILGTDFAVDNYIANNVFLCGTRAAATGVRGVIIDNHTAGKTYLYNNTIISDGVTTAALGVVDGFTDVIAKNNLVVNFGGGCFSGMTAGNCTNNASSDATATGTGARTNQTFAFVDAPRGDYRLAAEDTGAKDFGVSLTADTNFPVNKDMAAVNHGLWFRDDFNRANGAVGSRYVTMTGLQSVNISTNRANATSPGVSRSVSLVDPAFRTFSADQAAEATLTGATSFDFAGLVVRGTVGGNGYIFRADTLNSGQCFLYRYTALAETRLGYPSNSLEVEIGDRIRLQAVGTLISVYVNGVLRLSVTDATHASGQPGLFFDRQGSNTSYLDDFEAMDLGKVDIGAFQAPTLVTHTVKATGGDYTTLSAWETAQQRDLTGYFETAKVVCSAINDNGGSFLYIDGWTTSTPCRVVITADDQSYASPQWDTAKYRFTGTNGGLLLQEQNVDLIGLQLDSGASASNPAAAIWATGAGLHRIQDCFLRGGGALGAATGTSTVVVTNVVAKIPSSGYALNLQGGRTYYLSNVTADSPHVGVYVTDNSTVFAKNVLARGTSYSFFVASGTLTPNYCAGNGNQLASYGGANNRNNQTFSFVDSTNANYKLLETDTGARRFGTDLSADPLTPVPLDMARVPRKAGAWDIGADQSATTVVHQIAASGGDYTSLSAWEAAQQRDLSALNEIAVAECQAFADTTPVNINGWSTNVKYGIKVRAAAGAEAQMPWSTSAYRLEVATQAGVQLYEDYATFERVQLKGTTWDAAIRVLSGSVGHVVVDRSYLWGVDCSALQVDNGTAGTLLVRNSYLRASSVNNSPYVVTTWAKTNTLQNVTLIGPTVGVFSRGTSTVLATNVLQVGQGGYGFAEDGANGNLVLTNCASQDSSATDSWISGSGNSSNQTFTFADDYKANSTDLFNRANGGLGSNWATYGPSTWAISGNAGTRSGGTNEDNAIFIGGDPYTTADYSVSAECAVAGDSFFGVVGRWAQDGADFVGYCLMSLPSEDTIKLYRRSSNTWTLLATSSTFTVNSGQLYGLTLEMDGTTLRGYVNGALRVTATDSVITAPGRAGIQAYTTNFDNFQVRAVIKDYRLARSDVGAQRKGLALSSGIQDPFTIDFDGQTRRAVNWDIGADQIVDSVIAESTGYALSGTDATLTFTGGGGGDTRSINHTAGATADITLGAVFVVAADVSPTVTATYDGVAMTAVNDVDDAGNDYHLALFSKQPTTAPEVSFAATTSAGLIKAMAAVSFDQVPVSAGVRSSQTQVGTDDSPTITMTDVSTLDKVVAFVSWYGTSAIVVDEDNGEVLLGHAQAGNHHLAVISKPGSATTVTFNPILSGSSPWQIVAASVKSALAGAFTITAEAGSVVLTGQDASLEYGREVAAEAGAVALTGQDANLEVGREVAADPGAVVVTGQDANLELGREVAADSGAVTLAGQVANLNFGFRLVAEAGTVIVTGADAALGSNPTVAAEAGAIVITGTDASLERSRFVLADAGAVALNGTDASLEFGREVAADAGAVVLTGSDAALEVGHRLVADSAAMVISGTDANAEFGRKVAADVGMLAINGTDASLELGREVAAEAGTVALTGQEASLEFGREIAADAGSIVLTGTLADVRYSRRMVAEAGSVVITGSEAILSTEATLNAEGGALALAGQQASLEYNRRMVADGTTLAITGQEASLEHGREVAADAGSIVVTGTDASLEIGRRTVAESAAVVVAGQDAGLRRALRVSAESATFVITGSDAGLGSNPILGAEAGAVVLTGAVANTRYGRRMVAETGAVVVTGSTANTARSRLFLAEAAAFTLTPQDASLEFGRETQADSGAFSLGGQDAGLRRTVRLAADPAAFSLAAPEIGLRRAARVAADTAAFTLTPQDSGLRATRRVVGEAGTAALTGTLAQLLQGHRVASDPGTVTITGEDAYVGPVLVFNSPPDAFFMFF